MKLILALVFLTSSLATHSLVMVEANSRYTTACCSVTSFFHSRVEARCYLVSITTSSATLLVEGQDIDLNSDEASIGLLTKARGDAAPRVASQIASDVDIAVHDILGQGQYA